MKRRSDAEEPEESEDAEEEPAEVPPGAVRMSFD